MDSRKRQALVAAVFLALGLAVALFALQSTASNAQSKKGSILGSQVAQAQTPPGTPPATPPATNPPAGNPPSSTTTPPATPAAVPPTTPSLIVGGVDIGKQVTDSLARLRSILEGITDAASAQAAFRQLQEVITDIERFDVLFPQLSPEQRTALAAIVNPQMATINQLFDKVLAILGVADVLKPTVDSLRPKLAILTGAPAQTTTTAGAIVEIVIKEEKDNCIRAKRGQRPDASCCVEKLRLVRGTAQFTTNTGNVGNLTDVNTVACISPTGEISYSKSTESILGFDIAAVQTTVPGATTPGAAPGGAAPGGAPGGGQGAPGGGQGAPGAPATPPATPISLPGGNPSGGVTPPVIVPPVVPPTPPCVSSSCPQ